MAKFIKKVLLFFALIAIVDIVCGFGFSYLRSHAKGGDTQKNYYISEQCCDDILILGSSRAARHYDPKVLEDSLGFSCYNCGEPGCGIITAYARYGMITNRHNPQLIIYEVSPKFDYFKSDYYSKYLGRIRQYAYKSSVKDLFVDLGDNLEGIRLISNMYKNNSFVFQNVLDNVTEGELDRGYEPLFGVLKPDKQKRPPYNEQVMDSLKYSFIEKLIIESQHNNIKLIFMASPQYCNLSESKELDTEYDAIIELCKFHHVPFFNHTFIEGLSDNYRLFQDYKHLNQEGARVYTRLICDEIKEYM